MKQSTLATCLLASLLTAGAAAEELSMRTGVTWFRFVDSSGKALGFNELTVSDRKGGGYVIRMWTGCNINGQSVERTRSMELAPDANLVQFTYQNAITGEHAGLAREGEQLVGWHQRDEAAQRSNIAIARTNRIYGGLLYVLATAMPQRVGASLEVEELSAAGGITELGTATIRCAGEEKLAELGACFRYEKTTEHGRPLTLWVSPEREVLRIDWGGGYQSLRSPESTEALYQRIQPALREVPCEADDRLCLQGEFPGWSATQLFRHWVEPKLLERWWPEQANVEPEAGGAYRLAWPSIQREMQGKILALQVDRRLLFEWRWDGDTDAGIRHVEIGFTPTTAGTRLEITHGPYPDTPPGREERRGHAMGWQQFCTRLRDLEKSR